MITAILFICAYAYSGSDPYTTSSEEPTPPALTLSATACDSEAKARLPIVIRLRLHNQTQSRITSIFPMSNPEILWELSVLALKSKDGRLMILEHTGGVADFVNSTAPPPDCEFPAGAEQVVDKVFFPCVQVPASRVASGRSLDDRLEPVMPGVYDAWAEVRLPDGSRLVSNSFSLTIREPEGVDREAVERITARHFAFLAGQDWPSEPADYSREFNGRVNVSRFRQLQEVADSFPTSSYAEWIRIWKLFHHGSWEESIRFAREHRSFCLSDNLLLTVAQRSFEAREYQRCRGVLEELLREHPEGDCRAYAVDLLNRVGNRP